MDDNAAAGVEPPDRNLIGKIRRAIWPDHGTEAYRDAVTSEDAMLTVNPRPDQADAIVNVLEAAHPKHFDARLERWRNTG